MSTNDDSRSSSRLLFGGSLKVSLLFIALWSVLIPIKQADAATVPVGFQDRRLASGITSPSAIGVLPDGRVLIVQQNGVIRIIKNDVMLATPFYSVPNADNFFERGCLGIVADPDFAANHFVYIYCSIKNSTTNSNNRIIRVTEASDRVVAGSEQVTFSMPNIPPGPTGPTKWHQGGAMRFHPDGHLFFANGNNEDDPVNPPNTNAQLLTNPFGKVHRINKDGTIPSDNPFFNTTGAFKSIWARGFRSTFSMDIDRLTGRIFQGDVGQVSFEELDDVVRGANYGWPYFEANNQRIAPPGGFAHTRPWFSYGRSQGCAITGVAVYNPPTQQFPEVFRGKVLIHDFCTGAIRRLDPNSTAADRGVTGFVTGISFPTGMVVAPDGSLYYIARNQATGAPNPGGGSVHKITFTGTQAPRCNLSPEDATVSVGDSHTFRAGADGATSIQWQRADAATPTTFTNITGATGTSFTIASAQLSDNGDKFRLRATNSFGSVNCGPATLTVTSNRFPTAIIDTPAVGSQFNADTVVNFSGRGTDPEDGSIPASGFTWQIDYQHDTHSHPFMPATSGMSSGSITVPSFEANEANTWLRIFLTVRDSGGLINTAFRDVFPSRQLSSMTPTGTPVNGFGPFERDRSNGESAAGDGRTITLDGVPYPKGLGVHANSDLRFNVSGCTGNFVSDIGVDDEVGTLGSVVFQVFLDGQQVFTSGTRTGVSPRTGVNVSVAGKSELRLVVTDAGNGNASDHADWAGARVTGCSGAPTLAITNMNVRDATNAADWSTQSNLQVGNRAFGDRTYTWTNVGSLAGSAWIRPAGDSKTFTGNPLVTFNINVAADVFVALEDGIARPSWLDSTWTDTGENTTTRQSSTDTRTQSLFRKRFAAGQVSLGPQGSTAAANYMIIVK